MTQRLTVAILLTVWVTLLAAGTASYWATRAALLADLDQTLLAKAAALPELVPPSERAASMDAPVQGDPRAPRRNVGSGDTSEGGRYQIKSEGDRRTIPRATPDGGSGDASPELVSASFSTLADGRRVRTLTIRAMAKPQEPGGLPVPVLVTYSGSAEQFDRVLSRLLVTLGICGGFAGLLAAGIARLVSRASLRPLRDVTGLIGGIDERKLDRRVPVAALPAELTPMAQGLNGMLSKLQDAFARRRRFLADASHELRTPVAALVTGLEVALMRERSADAYRTALDAAMTDATHLRHLVARLMEQVRSEQFGHDEPWETNDVAELLDHCVAMARQLGQVRQVTVTADLPAGLRVRTQPGRLRSVISNLLANAVEYNRPAGTVRLQVRLSKSELQVRVQDTGVGIPQGQLETIFEPFSRGESARSGGDGHLGLGLFLVRTHVLSMGGRYAVTSQIGEGSEFLVTLPVEERTATVVPVDSSSASPPNRAA